MVNMLTLENNEDKMKRTYVLEQRNTKLENEVEVLKDATRPIIEVSDKETQTEENASDIGEVAN